MKTPPMNRIWILVLMSILLTSGIFAAIPWADTGNLYRQEVNISGATTTLTDLTHNFTINSGTVGPEFNFSIDQDSLRIYSYNSSSGINTLIPHFALTWNAGSSTATIQIKVPVISATQNASIWMYYRNSTKLNVENNCDTYIYCDQFNDASIDARLTTTDKDTVSGTVFSEGSGTLSITAGGADTWTGSDQYGSVFMNNIDGDVDVELAVTSITNTNSWTKAGIMFKNDMTAAGSSTGYVFNIWRPVNGASWQRDSNNNGFLDQSTTGSTTNSPDYVRIVKSGTSFTGYRKSNLGDAWTTIGSQAITSTLSTQDIGISLTSHAGSTLATATYDNFTIKRYTTDTFSETFGSEQKLPNNLSVTVNSPSTIVNTNVIQNETIIYNVTVSCNGIDPQGCGDLNIEIFRNITSDISSIATSSTTPVWTSSSNPQSCNGLSVGSSCSLAWTLNITGAKNELIKISSIASSNYTEIINSSSVNATIKVVLGKTVNFNQSNYDFGTFTKNSGDRTHNIAVIADNGNNTNIIVSCESGDCSVITDNFADGLNLNEGASSNFTFTCSDNNYGTYSATYNVTSNEFDGKSTIDVNCNVDPVYGPINGTLLNPPQGNTILVGQNKTFNLQARVDCTGLCGNITAYALLGKSGWLDTSFQYRQEINITTANATPINYQILLNLTGSLGSNFNWANSCNDVRFANNSNELNYWIETCNTSSNELLVWVESDVALSEDSNYTIDLYYGSNSAISKSNASATFRKDKIHLVTGRCPSSDTACNYMDNNAEANSVRSTINSSASYLIDGSGYVSLINQGSNIYGTDDNYYSRYRSLWIPSSSGSFTFGTASDDGSDVGLWKYDGYGYGLSTPTSISNHDTVSYWYGGHGSGTCGSTAATELTRTITAGVGYWIDYVMTEVGGGQDSDFCIDTGSGYNNFGTGSFGGEIFARNYVENEPSISSIGSEENSAISTTSGDTPLWTSSTQPQSCVPAEDGNCLFTWVVNATGLINSSHQVNVVFESNISSISDSFTPIGTVNITNNVAPTVTLLYPYNNSKIINSGYINFTWIVNDDEINNTCNIYLDGSLEYVGVCDTGVNSSYNLLVSPGGHTWFVEVFDSLNQTVNSSKFTFTSIYNYSLRFEKSISNVNTNQYNVVTSVTNLVANSTYNYSYLDFVPSEFNLGSPTPAFSFFNTTNGVNFNGRIYVWNLNTTITNVTYSLAAIGDYEVKDLYVVGGESR